jgi:hypothetical protein
MNSERQGKALSLHMYREAEEKNENLAQGRLCAAFFVTASVREFA